MKRVKHNLSKVLVAVFCLVVLLYNLSALGITPGRTTIDFESGLTREVPFSILNNDGKAMQVVFDVRGPLNQSVSLSQGSLTLGASEESASLFYTVSLPSELTPPGLHTADIVALEIPSQDEERGSFIGSRVSVVTQLHVHVPYPGKYLELDPQIINAQSDGTVVFLIAGTNRGKLDIASAQGTISIYNAIGEEIVNVETDEREIRSGERKELIGKWERNVQPGQYRAVVTVVYDGESVQSEKMFTIGEHILEIKKIEVNDFTLGEIAKFNALVENTYSEPVSGSYLELHVFNDEDEVMADIKSQTYDLGALETINMIAYWDTVGVKEGTYDGTLFLESGKGSFDRDITLKVDKDAITVFGLNGEVLIEKVEQSNLITILLIAVGILIAMNFMWFIVLRRFMNRKKYGKGIGFGKK